MCYATLVCLEPFYIILSYTVLYHNYTLQYYIILHYRTVIVQYIAFPYRATQHSLA